MRNISIFFGFASNLLFLGVSILAIIVLSDDMGLNLMIWDADFVKGISGILISSITALILFFKVYKKYKFVPYTKRIQSVIFWYNFYCLLNFIWDKYNVSLHQEVNLHRISIPTHRNNFY